MSAKNLTDAELRHELTKLGVKNLGPITKTTRSVYEKKLEKMKNDAKFADDSDGTESTVSNASQRRKSQRHKPVVAENEAEIEESEPEPPVVDHSKPSTPPKKAAVPVPGLANFPSRMAPESKKLPVESIKSAPEPKIPGLANFPSKNVSSIGAGRSFAKKAEEPQPSGSRLVDKEVRDTSYTAKTGSNNWGLSYSDSDEDNRKYESSTNSSIFKRSTAKVDENRQPRFESDPITRFDAFASRYDSQFTPKTAPTPEYPSARYTPPRDAAVTSRLSSYGRLDAQAGRFDAQAASRFDTQTGRFDSQSGKGFDAQAGRSSIFGGGGDSNQTLLSSRRSLGGDGFSARSYGSLAATTRNNGDFSKANWAPQGTGQISWSAAVSKKISDVGANLWRRTRNTASDLGGYVFWWRDKPANQGEYGRRPPFAARSFVDERRRGVDADFRYTAKKRRFWHFDDQTSRLILFGFIGFLLALTAAYLGMVHRETVFWCSKVVLASGLDTVEFIYHNLILPLVLLFSICLGVYGGYRYKKYQWDKQAYEQRQVYEMVEKIMEVVKEHHEKSVADGNRQPYLPVPHVRDMLIPIAQRKEMYPVWDKAVEMLNENESRIRTETQCIAGEEFMVWRWLQSAPNKKEEKMWQGHAFAEEDIPYNMPKYAYFECLKIRGLFDPDLETEQGWPEHVQDAILEKLGKSLRVLHMAVEIESKEGCVYMKFASREEAGQAYKILHGSWFNGRLVSVKYLRPERYHERFPDAVKASIPLVVKMPRFSTINLNKKSFF